VEPAIICTNLTKSYGTKGNLTPALRGIDLEVKTGELFMLVGPSGCGKTTLISVIAGILNHDEGSCRIFSHDLDAMEDAERTTFRGRNVGFVFQAYNLIPTLTTTENASIPLILNGVSRAEANERSREMLRQVRLASKLDTLPTELSGGQQQRVALARALVHEPRLIICDEPTASLDHRSGESVMERLATSAIHPDRAVIVVTHDSRVFHFAHRIIEMEDGLIRSSKTSESLNQP
jgi:putative ABC transport system ATP-binding protein